MGSTIINMTTTTLALILTLAAVRVAAHDGFNDGVSAEAVEEFCANSVSAVPGENVAACVKQHLTLSELNAGGKDPRDFILEGLNKAKAELTAAMTFTEEELSPKTNTEKHPLVFHLVVEGCKVAFNTAKGHIDMAVDHFGKRGGGVDNPVPISQLTMGLADVVVLTGGCIDAMTETKDVRVQKLLDHKLVKVEEMTTSMDAIVTTLTQDQSRFLLGSKPH